MAVPSITIRSNRFKVTDEAAYYRLLRMLKQENGKPVKDPTRARTPEGVFVNINGLEHALACRRSGHEVFHCIYAPYGVSYPEDENRIMDFVSGIQKILTDDSVFCLQRIASEKMNYVDTSAIVATRNESAVLRMEDCINAWFKTALNDPAFHGAKLDY